MKELLTALAAATLQFDKLEQTRINPFTNERNSSLQDLHTATKKALADNGLVLIQTINEKEGAWSINTLLQHVGGEIQSHSIPIKAPEDFTSLPDYFAYLNPIKVQMYADALGIALDDTFVESSPENYNYDFFSDEQTKQLAFELANHPEIMRDLCRSYGVNSLDKLPAQHYLVILSKVRDNIRARG